ncbi:hypothetical protein FRB94_005556 [Tulasnella sp. JGI-2019a]|nr:hypothetical protein FRB94_005556 [Tulasnella sp. JGI-2019a]
MRIRVPDSPLSSPEPSPPSSPSSPISVRTTHLNTDGTKPKRRTSEPTAFRNEPGNAASSASRWRESTYNEAENARVTTWEHREFYAAVKLRQRTDPIEETEERERELALKEAQERSERAWKPITNLLSSGSSNSFRGSSASPPLYDSLSVTPSLDQRIQDVRKTQLQEVEKILSELKINDANAKKKRLDADKLQKKEFWDSIDRTIQIEEAAARKIAEEKAAVARAEAERIRKINEEEQRKAQEVIDAKKRADDAETERKAQGEAEKRRKQEEEQQKAARVAAEEKQRQEKAAAAEEAEKMQGLIPRTGRQELQRYWQHLQTLKMEIMPMVRPRKGDTSMVNPEWKRVWSATRRSFTPKIGQVTNSISEINRIANLIHASLKPSPPHPEKLYVVLLSSLAKAFLLQAETEVTAKPSTAFPLARLILKIVELGHTAFPDIFMSRLLGRSGGWALGTTMPRQEGQSDESYRKTLGYMSDEKSSQYTDRVIGMITLYFAILQTPIATSPPSSFMSSSSSLSTKIPPIFQFHRTWTWFARVASNMPLLENRAAAQLMYAVVEVTGDKAIAVYGRQMVKWRRTIGKRCMDEGPDGESIGGRDGKPARIRLGLLLQKWEKEGAVGGEGRDAAT